MASSTVKRLRCAIYTRKSTEEGLERAFNSLDAQREACAAYILSQRHEGWTLHPDLYDDGGFSGGNMDRPGLRQLLSDVRTGRVDVVVVYKGRPSDPQPHRLCQNRGDTRQRRRIVRQRHPGVQHH
jgi:site-specific DNA recombinase